MLICLSPILALAHIFQALVFQVLLETLATGGMSLLVDFIVQPFVQVNPLLGVF